uniref:Uncharacterized protein n=1 Tax=Arundo donax TaxID=35708 RepID=A0A0A9D206_ARUDO
MAVKGKGERVASDPPCTVKASGSGPGCKRRGPDRDAEPSSSSTAAKRRRRAGVLQSDDAAACVSDAEEEGKMSSPRRTSTTGSARTREGVAAAGAVGLQEWRRRQLNQSRTHTISLNEMMNLDKTAKLLIPFADFLHLVKEITERQSRKVSRWTPKGLLFLHEASDDYLLEVFKGVNELATGVMAQPNLLYGDDTKLTPEQEAAARGLSRACTFGIPAYICTMKKSNVIKRQLAFSRDFSKRYILPRLGYDGCETKIFCGLQPGWQ